MLLRALIGSISARGGDDVSRRANVIPLAILHRKSGD